MSLILWLITYEIVICLALLVCLPPSLLSLSLSSPDQVGNSRNRSAMCRTTVVSTVQDGEQLDLRASEAPLSKVPPSRLLR